MFRELLVAAHVPDRFQHDDVDVKELVHAQQQSASEAPHPVFRDERQAGNASTKNVTHQSLQAFLAIVRGTARVGAGLDIAGAQRPCNTIRASRPAS